MKITVIKAIKSTQEVEQLSRNIYGEGFYIVNDQLWLKDTRDNVNFIWSGIQGYFHADIYSEEALETKTYERGDTISEEFLLKVLAIAKEPALIKEI